MRLGIGMAGGVWMAALMTYALNKANCQPFQLLIDTWFYAASSLFLAGVLIIRGGYKIIKWPHVVVASAFYGYVVYYLITHNNDYGFEYRNYLIFQFLSRGLFLIILVDVMFCHNIVKINLQDKWYVAACVVSMVIVVSLNYGAVTFMLFPLLGLLVTNISVKKWEKITLSMSVGYFLMWAALMAKSLIQKPYGSEGRYYSGNFGAPISASLITVGAFVCALLLLDRSLRWSLTDINKAYKTAAIIVCLGCVICAGIAVSMIGVRSGQLAVLVTLFTYVLLYDNNTRPEKLKKKRIVMLSIAGGIVSAIIVSAIILANLNVNWNRISEYVPGALLKNKIVFLGAQISSLSNRKSYAGVLPEGSVWNAIDRLSADRISIWYEQIRHMNLCGSSDLGVLDGNGPHSVYLWVLRKFGWIGGIPLCICFIWGVIICIKRVLRGKKEYMCSFLWIIAFLAFGLTDQVQWQYSLGFFFVIMQYPLVIDMRNE